jgi:hypothetical protein
VGQQGVAHVGRAVDPIAGLRVTARLDHASALPLAQRGRANAEPFRHWTDEHVATLPRHGFEVTNSGFDGPEGTAVVQKPGVTLVDDLERIGRVPVDRLHDRRGRLVAVSGHEGEERAQCLRVQRRVGAVAMRGAFSRRKDPDRLVVPDRLRGQTVSSRQVNRPELTLVLKVSYHRSADIAEKFTPLVQRYR